MKTSSISFLIFAVAFMFNANAGIELKIDSISHVLNAKDTTLSVLIKWKLCNNSSTILQNVDGLWYNDVENVKYDSTMWKVPKAKIENLLGIGNTRIMLFQSDAVTFPLSSSHANMDLPLTSHKRSTLSPTSCLVGGVGGNFKILRGDLDSLNIQIEYDTRFQKDGGKPLWRGRLLSNKQSFKVHEDSAGIKQSPVKPTKLK
jgi:hypothetical protein